MFDYDLLVNLCEWKKNGEEVILMGYFNQHLHEGKLQEVFTAEDIGLEDQSRKLNVEDAPLSHNNGSTPICGVFAKSGMNCESASISSYKGGMGDHRLHVLYFSAESILGLDTPSVCKPDRQNL